MQNGRLVNCAKLGVYVPKDFVQSRRFPTTLQMPERIAKVELFSEMFMATFSGSTEVVIFNKTSRIVAKMNLAGLSLDTSQHSVRTVDLAIFPRLKWSDRLMDIEQQGKKVLPKKLIFAGQDSEECAYLMIYDRARERPSVVHIFGREKGSITELQYGPYDNGHIVIGFDTGVIAILDSLKL